MVKQKQRIVQVEADKFLSDEQKKFSYLERKKAQREQDSEAQDDWNDWNRVPVLHPMDDDRSPRTGPRPAA